MKKADVEAARARAAQALQSARIAVTRREAETIEVADLGLGRLDVYGLQIITYVNNERYCAKELILFPRQICPEHRHPPVDDRNPGKQETFRCRSGWIALYVPGPPTPQPLGRVPDEDRAHFTAWCEIILNPGDEYTLPPDTLHWFQAGPEGAIVSEFSSANLDERDVYTDPRIRRIPEVD